METEELNFLTQSLDLFKPDRILYLVLGFVALTYSIRGLNYLANRLYDKIPSKRLLILQINTILSFSLSIFGGFSIVYISLKPPKELLLALGGSAAVAIGFSLKDIVASVLAGLVLLFDRPFQVGDRVAFGGEYGEITKIGLRSVKLSTLDDNSVTIPNSKFLTDVVASGNSGALDMMVVTKFHVPIQSDLQKIRELLYEILVTSRYVYLAKNLAINFEEKFHYKIPIIECSVKAYVFDVKYEKHFQTDIVTRANREFQRLGIQSAF